MTTAPPSQHAHDDLTVQRQRPPETQSPPLAWGPDTASSSWREGALTRIHELDALHRWLMHSGRISERQAAMDEAVHAHLRSAQDAAEADHNWWRLVSGAIYERTNSNCDAAEATMLRLAPNDFLIGQLPSLVAHVQRHLPTGDSRRVGVETLAGQLEKPPTEGAAPVDELTERQRTQLVTAVRGASSQAGREQTAVRSFRNVLGVTTMVLIVLAAAVAILGFLRPAGIPLCFTPEQGTQELVVCPTGQSALHPTSDQDIDNVTSRTVSRGDLFTVEFIGLIAAAIAAAAGLRQLRGSTLPFGLPAMLAVLKLPTGALTAFVGLLLMRGQFVPGLSALDSSAQILAWAALFGYAQQVFTRLVDQQAHSVLDRVRGAKHQESTDV
ncbi:MAG: hypothetical protein QOE01_2996 [Actinomycetota bacterium]|jgi:hypothetical protein|nr:hypothetical protein [Actinomycetota bacterium]